MTKSREYLASWIDGLAPGQRKGRLAIGPRREKISLEEKIRAVAELGGRDGTAAEVAARHGVAREHRPEPADEQGEGPSGGLPEGQVEA